MSCSVQLKTLGCSPDGISIIANSVSRILALSSHFVRCVFTSHPTFSPLYDHLDHTKQIFSESLWHPLSTDDDEDQNKDQEQDKDEDEDELNAEFAQFTAV